MRSQRLKEKGARVPGAHQKSSGILTSAKGQIEASHHGLRLPVTGKGGRHGAGKALLSLFLHILQIHWVQKRLAR